MAKKKSKKPAPKPDKKPKKTVAVRVTGTVNGIKIDAKGATAAEAAREMKKQAKEQQRAAIGKKIAKLTEMSKTTAGQALALVTTWDESDEKSQVLKDAISGLKGQIQGHKTEMRRLAREEKSRDADTVMIGKSMAGLERDMERWEVILAGKVEDRTGHQETKKCAMMELRKLIKDKAEGGLLFEKPQEGEPTGAGKDSPSPEKNAKQPPPRSAEEVGRQVQNGTKPPSTSPTPPAAGSTPPFPTVGRVYKLTDRESGEKYDIEYKVLRHMPTRKVIICNAATGRGEKELDPNLYVWDEYVALN